MDTRRLIDRWLANDLLRQVRFTVGENQNPEYRIAEGARGDGPITMTVGLLTALLIAAIFIGILWNVGGDLVIGVLGHVLTVPKSGLLSRVPRDACWRWFGRMSAAAAECEIRTMLHFPAMS
jgi:ABC-type uncharacterized transport system fused permease/ATPase subunit